MVVAKRIGVRTPRVCQLQLCFLPCAEQVAQPGAAQAHSNPLAAFCGTGKHHRLKRLTQGRLGPNQGRSDQHRDAHQLLHGVAGFGKACDGCFPGGARRERSDRKTRISLRLPFEDKARVGWWLFSVDINF